MALSTRRSTTIWEVVFGPSHGMRFVGGLFPKINGRIPLRIEEQRLVYDATAPFMLDTGTATFVGIEENIFGEVVAMARAREGIAGQIGQLIEQTRSFYSGFSLLRDGSVIGPSEFFRPVAQRAF